jgi:hypothetical protein
VIALKTNLNTGTPWSSWDDRDIRWSLDHNRLIEEIADFLCWMPSEIRQRIKEIAEADAIGTPSPLRDGHLTQQVNGLAEASILDHR